MKRNVGSLDRAIRIILGIVLLALIWIYPDSPYRWWGLIGLIPLLTGLFGTCPLYSILGIKTCKDC